MNLPETLQQHFGFAPLKKIDPNTQEVIKDSTKPDNDRLGQAAIPAVLTGLYKYSTQDEGAADILRGAYSTDWVEKVFGQHYDLVVDHVAAYSFTGAAEAEEVMNNIAIKAGEIAKQQVEGKSNPLLAIKEFFTGQRKTILSYLPAAMQVGQLIDDDTVDDRTNKMEGPISSLMKSIGSGFTNVDLDSKKSHQK